MYDHYFSMFLLIVFVHVRHNCLVRSHHDVREPAYALVKQHVSMRVHDRSPFAVPGIL